MKSGPASQMEDRFHNLDGMAQSVLTRASLAFTFTGHLTQNLLGRISRMAAPKPVDNIGSLSQRNLEKFTNTILQRYPAIADKFNVESTPLESSEQDHLVLSPPGQFFPASWTGQENLASPTLPEAMLQASPGRPPATIARKPEEAAPKQTIQGREATPRKPGIRPVSRIEEIASPVKPGLSRLQESEPPSVERSLDILQPEKAQPAPPAPPSIREGYPGIERKPERAPLAEPQEKATPPAPVPQTFKPTLVNKIPSQTVKSADLQRETVRRAVEPDGSEKARPVSPETQPAKKQPPATIARRPEPSSTTPASNRTAEQKSPEDEEAVPYEPVYRSTSQPPMGARLMEITPQGAPEEKRTLEVSEPEEKPKKSAANAERPLDASLQRSPETGSGVTPGKSPETRASSPPQERPSSAAAFDVPEELDLPDEPDYPIQAKTAPEQPEIEPEDHGFDRLEAGETTLDRKVEKNQPELVLNRLERTTLAREPVEELDKPIIPESDESVNKAGQSVFPEQGAIKPVEQNQPEIVSRQPTGSTLVETPEIPEISSSPEIKSPATPAEPDLVDLVLAPKVQPRPGEEGTPPSAIPFQAEPPDQAVVSGESPITPIKLPGIGQTEKPQIQRATEGTQTDRIQANAPKVEHPGPSQPELVLAPKEQVSPAGEPGLVLTESGKNLPTKAPEPEAELPAEPGGPGRISRKVEPASSEETRISQTVSTAPGAIQPAPMGQVPTVASPPQPEEPELPPSPEAGVPQTASDQEPPAPHLPDLILARMPQPGLPAEQLPSMGEETQPATERRLTAAREHPPTKPTQPGILQSSNLPEPVLARKVQPNLPLEPVTPAEDTLAAQVEPALPEEKVARTAETTPAPFEPSAPVTPEHGTPPVAEKPLYRQPDLILARKGQPTVPEETEEAQAASKIAAPGISHPKETQPTAQTGPAAPMARVTKPVQAALPASPVETSAQAGNFIQPTQVGPAAPAAEGIRPGKVIQPAVSEPAEISLAKTQPGPLPQVPRQPDESITISTPPGVVQRQTAETAVPESTKPPQVSPNRLVGPKEAQPDLVLARKEKPAQPGEPSIGMARKEASIPAETMGSGSTSAGEIAREIEGSEATIPPGHPIETIPVEGPGSGKMPAEPGDEPAVLQAQELVLARMSQPAQEELSNVLPSEATGFETETRTGRPETTREPGLHKAGQKPALSVGIPSGMADRISRKMTVNHNPRRLTDLETGRAAYHILPTEPTGVLPQVRRQMNQAVELEEPVSKEWQPTEKRDSGQSRPLHARSYSALPGYLPLASEPKVRATGRAPSLPAVSPAPQLTSAPASATMIQRTVEPNPPPIIRRAADDSEDEEAVDLNELAKEVYPLIKRMLAIERERWTTR